MSRNTTQEQRQLSRVETLLYQNVPDYEERLQVLEACASKIGFFDIEQYWSEFGIRVDDKERIKDIAMQIIQELSLVKIPSCLALSSLSREPIPISEKKKKGAFYTDYRLAQFVAEDCFPNISVNCRIADIAAGSGILLAAVAELYYSKYPTNYDRWISTCVYAFDLSPNALRGARIALMVHSSSVESIHTMTNNWVECDSLLFENAFPQFDVVVGNPPWGKIKLSRHSFANKTDDYHFVYGSVISDFDDENYSQERKEIIEYSKTLKLRYSLLRDAEPDMYMAFLQRAISVLSPHGHLSYIVPAGLIRSQGAESLRRYLLGCSEKVKYFLLDNRASFFDIDSRFKFVIVSLTKDTSDGHGSETFDFEMCKAGVASVKKTKKIEYKCRELEAIRPDLTVPECRDEREKQLFFKIYRNGSLWKDNWSVEITREVDMTNDRKLFHEKKSDSDIPVIEGRMVQQFRFGSKAYISGTGRSAKWIPNRDGSVKAQFYMKPDGINPQLAKRINSLRAGFCDIAGQTNERSMMASVIPPGVVCGNKVPTIIFPKDKDHSLLYFFVGVTNSFVFDWLLRRIISTTVNYFLLFSLPMPSICMDNGIAQRIIRLSKQLSDMEAGYYTDKRMGMIRAELDLYVALAYGLNFTDLELILKDFPLLDRKQPPLNNETRSTYTRDLFLSIAEREFNVKDSFYTKRANDAEQLLSKAYIPTEMVELEKENKDGRI